DLTEDFLIETDNIPILPAAVISIYNKVTATLYYLGQNPTNPVILKQVNNLN
ncbi:hypothetical protein LZ30DRAFT_607841, partial [Colletotrichum cereale]